jgi:cytochrome c oxidase subunit 2
LFAFRRRKGDQTDGPPIEGNVPLEILWTAIPTVIVFILAVYSFEVYTNIGGLNPKTAGDVKPGLMAHHHGGHLSGGHNMIAMGDQPQKIALGIGPSLAEDESVTPVVVDVKGIQFAWIFTYPDTGIVSGELHIPVNRPVQLNISASDVLHAVWIPELRLKQDAIPGRDSTLAFISNRVGEYPIICAELCGSYHGGMKAIAYVQTEEDFNKWVEENTLAQSDQPEETVAFNPATASEGEFLTPYAEEMGISNETLAEINSLPHHHGM